MVQWIDLRETLQENPIFYGNNNGFLQIFPQSNDWSGCIFEPENYRIIVTSTSLGKKSSETPESLPQSSGNQA